MSKTQKYIPPTNLIEALTKFRFKMKEKKHIINTEDNINSHFTR